MQSQRGGFAVEGIDDDAFGADAADAGKPLRPRGILGIVEGFAVVFAAEKERLDDEIAVEGAELVGNLLNINRHDGRIDDVEHLLRACVELQHRVLDALQRAHNLRTVELRGVRQAGDDRLRVVFVAQNQQSVNDLVEPRIQGRLAVAREGDAIHGRMGTGTFGQLALNSLHHDFQRIGFARVQILFQRPTALAIETVERTDFLIHGHKVDAQGVAQSSAMYRAKSD